MINVNKMLINTKSQSKGGNKNNKGTQSPTNISFEKYKQKGMDWFENMIFRMKKPENHREAMIVGSGFLLFGGVFTFAGAQFLSVLFSIICAIGLGVLITGLLCLIFNVEWDSEAGIVITTVSMMLSAPFVKFALAFAD